MLLREPILTDTKNVLTVTLMVIVTTAVGLVTRQERAHDAILSASGTTYNRSLHTPHSAECISMPKSILKSSSQHV